MKGDIMKRDIMKGYRMFFVIPALEYFVFLLLLLIFGLSQGCSKGSGGETGNPTDPSASTTASSGTGTSTGGTGTSTGTDSGTSSGGKSGGTTWGFEVDPGSLNFGSREASIGTVSLTFNVINTGSTEIDVSMDCGPNPFAGGYSDRLLRAGETDDLYAYFYIDTVGNFSGSCTVTGTSPATRERMTRTVALSGTVLVPKPPPAK